MSSCALVFALLLLDVLVIGGAGFFTLVSGGFDGTYDEADRQAVDEAGQIAAILCAAGTALTAGALGRARRMGLVALQVLVLGAATVLFWTTF